MGISVASTECWNLGMLVFVKAGKPEKLEKNSRNRDKNQQQIQPTYGINTGN